MDTPQIVHKRPTIFRSITHLKKSRATSQRIQAAGITKEFSAPNLEKKGENYTQKHIFTQRDQLLP